MADYPAMPLWTDAYLGDTLHLSLEEHGAYLKMLMIAWRDASCRLPDDDRRIATMLGVTTTRWRGRLRPALEPFWIIEDGWWRNKKLEKVREMVTKSSEKQRVKAKQRWGDKSLSDNESGKAAASPAAMPQGMQPKPKPKPYDPDSSLRSESPPRAKSNGHVQARPPPGGFEQFWQCWDIPGTKREPRKAEAVYRALIRKGEATHEELCDGVRRYMRESRESGRAIGYIKYPTTWLNKGCWKDEERRDEHGSDQDRRVQPASGGGGRGTAPSVGNVGRRLFGDDP